MKAGATAILVAAAVVYGLTFLSSRGGAGALGYVRAAAEAAMIGGLADWFAVTALFRRPLGLPIPHTALIPARKDALGRSLQDFVGEYFLTPDVLVARIEAAAVPGRVGAWLADADRANRLAAEAGSIAAAALRVIERTELESVVADALRERLEREPVAGRLGALAVPVLAAGGHHALLDVILERLHGWLTASPDALVALVEQLAPEWSPRFLDRVIARRIHAAAARITAEVAADRHHPLRRRLDADLLRVARRVRDDPDSQARLDAAIRRALEYPETVRSLRALLEAGRELVAEQLSKDSDLRTRIVSAIRGAGERLQRDARWQRAVDRWATAAVNYVALHFRDEITRVITDTVDRWEGRDAARRIELHIGRDLQFIRINGAVVGAAAGVVIHLATVAFA